MFQEGDERGGKSTFYLVPLEISEFSKYVTNFFKLCI